VDEVDLADDENDDDNDDDYLERGKNSDCYAKGVLETDMTQRVCMCTQGQIGMCNVQSWYQ
jgi:hypothetical protein